MRQRTRPLLNSDKNTDWAMFPLCLSDPAHRQTDRWTWSLHWHNYKATFSQAHWGEHKADWPENCTSIGITWGCPSAPCLGGSVESRALPFGWAVWTSIAPSSPPSKNRCFLLLVAIGHHLLFNVFYINNLNYFYYIIDIFFILVRTN